MTVISGESCLLHSLHKFRYPVLPESTLIFMSFTLCKDALIENVVLRQCG